MIEISSGTPENLIIVVARGKVTGEDFEKILVPAIDEKLKTHKRIRLLYQMAEDFSGFTAEAMWDDVKLGLGHLTGFESVAVVTDALWIADAVKFFGIFLRCPVKAFKNGQLDEAKDWVAHNAWRSVSEAL